MLSNIHQIPSFRVDATYDSGMHSVLDEAITKKIQALSRQVYESKLKLPGVRGFGKQRYVAKSGRLHSEPWF
jgi:hypothetical protein